MSVLFPAMLAGLLGCAVPIALHLIARHKFRIRHSPRRSFDRFRAGRKGVVKIRLGMIGRIPIRSFGTNRSQEWNIGSPMFVDMLSPCARFFSRGRLP